MAPSTAKLPFVPTQGENELVLSYKWWMRRGVSRASSIGGRAHRVAVLSIVLWGCSSNDESTVPPTTDLTYCDAQVIIEDKCLRCHTEGGEVDTPFSLDTYEEVSSRATSIERVVKNGSMPFVDRDLSPPVEPLTTSEKEMFLEWLAAGAPEGDDACD